MTNGVLTPNGQQGHPSLLNFQPVSCSMNDNLRQAVIARIQIETLNVRLPKYHCLFFFLGSNSRYDDEKCPLTPSSLNCKYVYEKPWFANALQGRRAELLQHKWQIMYY